MITIGSVTFTDKAETHDVYERFYEQYSGNPPIADCAKCGKVTCYIVEKCDGARPERKGVAALFNLTPASAIVDSENKLLYIPSRVCHECGARHDAYVRYPMGPDLRGLALTEDEKKSYLAIYRLKMGDIKADREKAEAQVSRYGKRSAGVQ